MEISTVGGGGSKTNSLDPEKPFGLEVVAKNKSNNRLEGWLGNGEAAETKRRKDVATLEEDKERKKIKRSVGVEYDDITQHDTSSPGVVHKINGVDIIGSNNNLCDDGHGVIIPKRPRGSFGRSKFAKNRLSKPSTVSGGSVENAANLRHDELKQVPLQHEVSGDPLDTSTQQTVQLGVSSVKRKNKGVLALKAFQKHAPAAVNGDLVNPIGSMGSKDQVAKSSDDTGSKEQIVKLRCEIKEIQENKDAHGLSGNSTSAETMDTFNGNLKGKIRNSVKKKGTVGNQKLEENSNAAVVLNDKDLSSKRNGSNRRKRKTLASSSETVAKKDVLNDVDPDDDLEQNAARMLSSRFDPSCTGFASKNRTLALSSANGESKLTANVDSEGPMSSSDPASTEGADRVLRPRRHQKVKGTSRKRRHFYDLQSDDMDAHWFLNRKIKIFWPLDESWYYGLVDDYDAEKNLHHIKYDDRDEEWISLEHERFKLLLLPNEVPHKPNSKDNRSGGIHKEDRNEENGIRPAFMATNMESEPIISWLSRPSDQVKSSSSTSLKKKKITHVLDVHNSDNTSCSTAFLNISIGGKKKENSVEGHLPIVYVRRRCRKFGDVAPCSLNSESLLKFDTTIIAGKKFEIGIKLWPMLTYVLGVDILWLLHSVLLFQRGTVVTMWPTVYLEVLFVDNIVGLRLFVFEGCLNKAVAFVFFIMKMFCEPEKNESINQQIPVTSIRFKLSFVQNTKNQKVSECYSFSKVREYKWQYLDSEFQPHCLSSKQLPISECTYDNVKLLEAGRHHSRVPYDGQTAFNEVFRKKSNSVAVPLLCSSRSSASTIYGLKHGNLPAFALSFTAAPSFFIGLHLKLLLERSISLQDYAANDCSHVDDHYEVSSESSSKSHEEAICSNAVESFVNPYNCEGHNQPQRHIDQDTAGSSRLNGLSVEIPVSDEVCKDFQRTPGTQQASELTWNVNDDIIYSPNSESCRSLWHHSKSSPFIDPLHPWTDRNADFVGNGLGNGPKKPRTQVQYTLPSREIINFKNKGHNNNNQNGLPYQRIRKANDKKAFDGSKGPRRNLELVACDANLLINSGDRGWRECGTRVFFEAADQNEWKLVVKYSGEVKYTYKVHQDFQSGSTNRYTHAMMWKGGKNWTLEFPDRSQWSLFKEMHEECHNRNIRAASIKNIPIPGVRLIEEWGDDQERRTSFVRTRVYFSQVKNDAEMAMDTSHVVYDMDSEDEEWVCRSRASCNGSEDDMISYELFEKVMDMLEKVSYAQKRDHFTSGEIEELIANVSPLKDAKSIYDHWREKRQRKGMPLIRQLQPPLWERYEQMCREWNKSKPRLTGGTVSGSQGKASGCDKPPMFAFCLKPRGLELLHKGSKHRPHKKISLSGHSHAFLGDHDTHPSSGRRVNAYAFGDDRAESSDVSPLVNKMSPREAGHFSLGSGEAADWNHHHQLRIQRNNNSRSVRTAISPKVPVPVPVASHTIRKSGRKNNNGKRQNDPQYNNHHGQRVWSGSDLDEFRLRDASSAAKHARNMAKLKRERAQKLMLSADLAIHKAVSALMTAEAIRASCTGDDNDDERIRSTSTTTSTG